MEKFWLCRAYQKIIITIKVEPIEKAQNQIPHIYLVVSEPVAAADAPLRSMLLAIVVPMYYCIDRKRLKSANIAHWSICIACVISNKATYWYCTVHSS